MRRFFVRFIAVLFILLGLWNIILFLHEIFYNHYGNLTYLFNSIILVSTGDHLYRLREWGRKLAIGVFGLHILMILFFSFLEFSDGDFGFSIHALGYIYESDSLLLYAAMFIPMVLIDVFSALMLLQKETRALFDNRSWKAEVERLSQS